MNLWPLIWPTVINRYQKEDTELGYIHDFDGLAPQGGLPAKRQPQPLQANVAPITAPLETEPDQPQRRWRDAGFNPIYESHVLVLLQQHEPRIDMLAATVARQYMAIQQAVNDLHELSQDAPDAIWSTLLDIKDALHVSNTQAQIRATDGK